MYSLFWATSLFILLPLFVSADGVNCAGGCQIAVSYFTFNTSIPYTTDESYYQESCQTLLRLQSVYLCMKEYCAPQQIATGVSHLNSDCEKYGKLEILPYSVVDSVKNVSGLPVVDVADLGTVTPFNTTIHVAEPLYSAAYLTSLDWNKSVVARADYGYAMFGFWSIVIVIGFISRVASILNAQLLHPKHKSSESSTVARITKQYVTYPALFSQHCADPLGWCTIPQRLQALTIAAFVIINVVLCCVNYNLFEGNLYWANTRTQLWRYLADRTGVLAIANLPLLWAFAMRNNVLLWITGWSFATFNQFHRWVARVATVEAVLHSIAYTVEAFLEGGKTEYVSDWTYRYWWCGVIATIAMSFLCGLSIQPLRRYAYEIFLILHIGFAILLLPAMWFHVEIFDGEYNGYIWPCVAVWAFDRFLRIGRLIILNLPFSKSVVTYNSASNVIRLSVPTTNLLKPVPGSYYFVYTLSSWKFWESHPFTLSSWGNTSKSFILRPYGGFTASLRNKITQSSSAENTEISTLSMQVLIEGPYGNSHNLQSYDEILMIIGGSGITVALSHLQALATTNPSPNNSRHPKIIRLIWTMRSASLYHDIYASEFHSLLDSPSFQQSIRLKIEVFITGRPETEVPARRSNSLHQIMTDIKEQSISAETTIKDLNAEVTVADLTDDKHMTIENASSASDISSNHTTFQPHRPVIHDIVQDFCHDNKASGAQAKRLAIVACGPQRMADDVRASVARSVGQTKNIVDFLPENFGW